MKKFLLIGFISLLFVEHSSAKNLFKYKNDQFQWKLAKSATKLDDSSYQIELDLSKKVKRKPLTAKIVKDSLEAKLGKTFALAVTIKSPSTLILSYKGDERKFLKRLSRTRIKHKNQVSLAMESTVTGSGIRAKEGKLQVSDDQIRVKILKFTDIGTKILVLETGKNQGTNFKQGRTAEFLGTKKGLKPGEIVVINPIRKDDSGWMMAD